MTPSHLTQDNIQNIVHMPLRSTPRFPPRVTNLSTQNVDKKKKLSGATHLPLYMCAYAIKPMAQNPAPRPLLHMLLPVPKTDKSKITHHGGKSGGTRRDEACQFHPSLRLAH